MESKFKNEQELANGADKWFEDVIFNRFNYKGNPEDINDPQGKNIKKFLKLKKIHISVEANEEKGIDKIIINHKFKPKYVLIIDYKNLTLKEETV